VDSMADDPDPSGGSDAEIDTLRENYELETLRDDAKLQSEIDTLEKRISVLEDRTPDHVETLRAEKAALETLAGTTVQNWGTVRQKVDSL